jgi:hypothetical protein
MSQYAVTIHCLSYKQMLLIASHFIWQAYGIVLVIKQQKQCAVEWETNKLSVH